jgi:hypothetical protein
LFKWLRRGVALKLEQNISHSREDMMKIRESWVALLVLVGGVAIGKACASQLQKRHQQEIELRKSELHRWEGEGGNLAPTELRGAWQ